MATAACWASATSGPVAAESRQSCWKMVRWSGPGPTILAVGRSKSDDVKEKADSVVDGGSKIRRLVATRTNPASTRTERAKGSGQAGQPSGIFRVIGCGSLNMSIDQDIDIGEQHPPSGIPGPELQLVVIGLKRARSVKVHTVTGTTPAYRDKPKGRWVRRIPTFHSIVQRPGDKGAHAQALF